MTEIGEVAKVKNQHVQKHQGGFTCTSVINDVEAHDNARNLQICENVIAVCLKVFSWPVVVFIKVNTALLYLQCTVFT